MATLVVQKPSLTGVTVTFVSAAGGGDVFPNTGREFIHIKNGDASSHDITVNSVTPCDQGADHDLVVAVGAGVTKAIGPFATTRFNDGSGNVSLTYSAVTSVTIAIVSNL